MAGVTCHSTSCHSTAMARLDNFLPDTKPTRRDVWAGASWSRTFRTSIGCVNQVAVDTAAGASHHGLGCGSISRTSVKSQTSPGYHQDGSRGPPVNLNGWPKRCWVPKKWSLHVTVNSQLDSSPAARSVVVGGHFSATRQTRPFRTRSHEQEVTPP